MNFPWIKRPDLIAVPHDTEGWVVKDPLTLQYALLNDVEYRLLNLLDGRLAFGELLKRAQDIDPTAGITADDLGEFIRNLAGHQLVQQRSGGDSLRLSKTQPQSAFGWLNPLLQVLRVQVKLLNPSRLIDAAMPIAQLFFRRSTVIVMSLTGCIGLLVALLNAGRIAHALPSMQEFLGPQNLLLMLSIFVAVKILHEAGHAFTARFFGAECNECGVMLMVFTPVLYTNVSDSWLLPRRQRMLVTAAGIIVELCIAAACSILWWTAAPGLTRSILLNTMILCSFNTLLFNGNPLLRFDGYFLLADWAGIPNLASRSSALLRKRFVGLLVGRQDDSQPEKNGRFLTGYGILAAAYRVILTFAILQLVDQMARHWHVQFLGKFLSMMIVLGFVVIPALSVVQDIRLANHQSRFTTSAWRRLAGFVLMLIMLMLFPLPHSVVAPAFVQPTAQAVYAPLPGRLESCVAYGTNIKPGDTIAQLSNSTLAQSRQRLESQHTQIDLELKALKNNPATSNSELIPSVEEALRAAQHRLKQFKAEYADLTITAFGDGVFMAPPAVPRQIHQDLPVTWSGTPADSQNRQTWIKRGTLMGYLGQPSQVQLLVAVSENDIEFVQSGQSVQFLTPERSGPSLTGVVYSVSQVEAEELPIQFSIAGLVSGTPREQNLKPANVTYLATVSLSDSTAVPPAFYSTGQVRISVAPSSLAARLQRYLQQTF